MKHLQCLVLGVFILACNSKSTNSTNPGTNPDPSQPEWNKGALRYYNLENEELNLNLEDFVDMLHKVDKTQWIDNALFVDFAKYIYKVDNTNLELYLDYSVDLTISHLSTIEHHSFKEVIIEIEAD